VFLSKSCFELPGRVEDADMIASCPVDESSSQVNDMPRKQNYFLIHQNAIGYNSQQKRFGNIREELKLDMRQICSDFGISLMVSSVLQSTETLSTRIGPVS
jgi:hypothetical protein